MNSRLKKCLESKAVLTLLAIVIAFFVGAIVLFAAGVNPILAYTTLLKNIFGNLKYMAWSVVYATPLIFTGLSVGCDSYSIMYFSCDSGRSYLGNYCGIFAGEMGD